MNDKTLPCLVADDKRSRLPVTFVVYAPFGGDQALSDYPNGETQRVEDHPLVASLIASASHGVNVCALIDRAQDDSWLVEIPAHGAITVRSHWKQDMGSPRVLASLLAHASICFEDSATVLAMEGHGAGYLPETDPSKATIAERTVIAGERVRWEIRSDSEGGSRPIRSADGQPLLPMGELPLPMGELPLPGGQRPLSTWGIGKALKDGLARSPDPKRKIGVVHFNNCFNMALELLHTVAPHAEYAAGYNNYNFFTAGRGYPEVFAKFEAAGVATSEQLALWFAEGNRDTLATLPLPHPTVGGVVRLHRMEAIAAAVDRLSSALIDALPAKRDAIRIAIEAAQQYDTGAGFQLEVPDNLTDVASLASTLSTASISDAVTGAAADLAQAVAGIKVYGEHASPWVAPTVEWDFTNKQLAMNILLPDPALTGLWDWRSPYYLRTSPSPAQPQVIEFLRKTRWVEFVVKYHQLPDKRLVFKGLLAPRIPEVPVSTISRYPKNDEPRKPVAN